MDNFFTTHIPQTISLIVFSLLIIFNSALCFIISNMQIMIAPWMFDAQYVFNSLLYQLCKIYNLPIIFIYTILLSLFTNFLRLSIVEFVSLALYKSV